MKTKTLVFAVVLPTLALAAVLASLNLSSVAAASDASTSLSIMHAHLPRMSAAQGDYCYRMRVGLNGNAVASKTCLLKDKPSKGGVSPQSVGIGSCSISDLQIFEDANFGVNGGAEICYWINGGGQSTRNLTDDWIIWPVVSWNDHLSSWKSGIYDGAFSWDTNGYGARYPFYNHMLCPYIGPYWNDKASWFTISITSGLPQSYC